MKIPERTYRLAGAGLGVFAAAILLTNILFWGQLGPGGRATMVASSIGAMGTLVLAAATLISVRQQAASIEDLQKEREKPLAIDEIQHTIQHAIAGAERNLEILESRENHFNWVAADGPAPHTIGTGPKEVIDKNPDFTAQLRFRQNAPITWAALENYEDLIEEISALTDEIYDQLQPVVQEYLEENDIDDADVIEVDELLKFMIYRVDRLGEQHPLFPIWEVHKEDFLDLAEEHAESEIRELVEKEDELERRSRELLDMLGKRKLELRREYGISSDDLGEETHEIPRGI